MYLSLCVGPYASTGPVGLGCVWSASMRWRWCSACRRRGRRFVAGRRGSRTPAGPWWGRETPARSETQHTSLLLHGNTNSISIYFLFYIYCYSHSDDRTVLGHCSVAATLRRTWILWSKRSKLATGCVDVPSRLMGHVVHWRNAFLYWPINLVSSNTEPCVNVPECIAHEQYYTSGIRNQEHLSPKYVVYHIIMLVIVISLYI